MLAAIALSATVDEMPVFQRVGVSVVRAQLGYLSASFVVAVLVATIRVPSGELWLTRSRGSALWRSAHLSVVLAGPALVASYLLQDGFPEGERDAGWVALMLKR